jgi:hypothetical protein
MVAARLLDVCPTIPRHGIALGHGAMGDTMGRTLVSAIPRQRARHEALTMFDASGTSQTTGRVFNNIGNLGRRSCGRGRSQ